MDKKKDLKTVFSYLHIAYVHVVTFHQFFKKSIQDFAVEVLSSQFCQCFILIL